MAPQIAQKNLQLPPLHRSVGRGSHTSVSCNVAAVMAPEGIATAPAAEPFHVVIVAGVAGLLLVLLMARGKLPLLADLARRSPAIGMPLSGALLFVWTMLLLPTTPLELCIGFAFGTRSGAMIVYFSKLLVSFSWFAIVQKLPGQHATRVIHSVRASMERFVRSTPRRACFIVCAAYMPLALKAGLLSACSAPPLAFVAATVSIELLYSPVVVSIGASAQGLVQDKGGMNLTRALGLLAMLSLFILLAIVGTHLRGTLITDFPRDNDPELEPSF